MKTPASSQKNAGFTIVELMIASAVFSVILLILTATIINVGRIYYRGVSSAKVQEAARAAIEDISQSIQFHGGSVVPNVPNPDTVNQGGICIGDKLYSYARNHRMVTPADPAATPESGRAKHVLTAEVGSSCAVSRHLLGGSPDFSGSQARELIPENIGLSDLRVTELDSDTYEIMIRLFWADVSDLEDTKDRCKSGLSLKYCAISELRTVVQKRVP